MISKQAYSYIKIDLKLKKNLLALIGLNLLLLGIYYFTGWNSVFRLSALVNVLAFIVSKNSMKVDSTKMFGNQLELRSLPFSRIELVLISFTRYIVYFTLGLICIISIASAVEGRFLLGNLLSNPFALVILVFVFILSISIWVSSTFIYELRSNTLIFVISFFRNISFIIVMFFTIFTYLQWTKNSSIDDKELTFALGIISAAAIYLANFIQNFNTTFFSERLAYKAKFFEPVSDSIIILGVVIIVVKVMTTIF